MNPDNRNEAKFAAPDKNPRGFTGKGLVFVATEFRAMFLHKCRDIPREFLTVILALAIFIPFIFPVHPVIPEQYRTAVMWTLIIASTLIGGILARKILKK